MKIEVGKTYKTRDGRKAVVTEDDGTDCYPMGVGIGDVGYWHDRDGRHLTWRQTSDDLVAEWVEAAPHIVAVTINGKPAPATKPFVHPSREAAVAEAKRLAALSPGSEFAVYQRVSAVTAEVVIKEAA